MYATILLAGTESMELYNNTGYAAGAIFALLILGYLIYTLLKPEKF